MSKLKGRTSLSARSVNESQIPTVAEILTFWFSTESGSTRELLRDRWFTPNREFDRLCRARFLAHYEVAAQGHLEHWREEALSSLALVLLLDQFPRNMFRGAARAFATDAKARDLSRYVVAQGFDKQLAPLMRMFIYLPFEHSETPIDQLTSVRLFNSLVAEFPSLSEMLRHAQQHQEVIMRFGRFPGRNEALGRKSTAEEIEFLKIQLSN
jgi:uncharacterized protein (DUF924 family)